MLVLDGPAARFHNHPGAILPNDGMLDLGVAPELDAFEHPVPFFGRNVGRDLAPDEFLPAVADQVQPGRSHPCSALLR